MLSPRSVRLYSSLESMGVLAARGQQVVAGSPLPSGEYSNCISEAFRG